MLVQKCGAAECVTKTRATVAHKAATGGPRQAEWGMGMAGHPNMEAGPPWLIVVLRVGSHMRPRGCGSSRRTSNSRAGWPAVAGVVVTPVRVTTTF